MVFVVFMIMTIQITDKSEQVTGGDRNTYELMVEMVGPNRIQVFCNVKFQLYFTAEESHRLAVFCCYNVFTFVSLSIILSKYNSQAIRKDGSQYTSIWFMSLFQQLQNLYKAQNQTDFKSLSYALAETSNTHFFNTKIHLIRSATGHTFIGNKTGLD